MHCAKQRYSYFPVWICGTAEIGRRRRGMFPKKKNINFRGMKRTAKEMYSPEELIIIANKKASPMHGNS